MDSTNSTATAPPSAPECFACFEGVVYIGYLVEDESGETEEIFEPVACRRCEAR
jgi:ribosomal protein L40E